MQMIALPKGRLFLVTYRGVYEQTGTINSVRVDEWTAELAIIASDGRMRPLHFQHRLYCIKV